MVVAAFILSGGIALLYTKGQARVYEAISMVEMSPHTTQPLGNKDDTLDIGSGIFFDSREYYETQYKIIASDRVLSTAARNLGLVHDDDFMGSDSPQRQPNLERATSLLRNHLIVEPVKYSRLVLIKIDDTSPRRAKQICDAVAAAYVDQNLQNSLTATSDAVAWLSGQVDNIKRELEHDEDALHEFKQRNDLPSTSINEASNMLRVELQEFDVALAHTRTKRQEIEARGGRAFEGPVGQP